MTLLELLVQELPKRGGWPEGAIECERFLNEPTIDFHYESGNYAVYCGEEYGPIAVKCLKIRKAGDGYRKENVKKEEYEAALAASKQVAWSGEGLPPVGCECELSSAVEFYTNSGSVDFEEGTIVVVGGVVNFGMPGFVAVKVKGSNCITDVNSCFLRPIRTEAERKRKEIAQQMCNIFGNGIEIDEKQGYGKAWLDVYDAIAAGKIPGIKLAD